MSTELKNPAGTARLATVASWAWLAIDLGLTLAALNTVRVLGGLGGPIADEAQLTAADLAAGGVGLLYTVGFILAGIAILRWILVVNRNAQRWSDYQSVSPGWNVGFLFIPIVNLWKPFTGVRETYQASVDPADPAAVPVPAVMRWWWAAWIATNILGNISFRLSLRAETADELITVSWVDIAAFPIDVVLVIALTTVIRRVTAAQAPRMAGGADGALA